MTINFDRIQGKLNILADAAKYDVSCSSSGSNRKNQGALLAIRPHRAFVTVLPKMGGV